MKGTYITVQIPSELNIFIEQAAAKSVRSKRQMLMYMLLVYMDMEKGEREKKNEKLA